MPYRASYLLQQQARGRGLPRGTPEDHLWPAVDCLSLWDLREAWGMGASVHARNRHGQGVLAALTDAARGCSDPRRGLTAVQDALRHGARLGTSEADVRALHQWLAFPQPEWLALAVRHAPHLWTRRFENRTALHVLAAHADEAAWATAQRLAPVPKEAWDAVDGEGRTPVVVRGSMASEPLPRRPKP